MRWDFPAWGEVREANETPGIKLLLIQSSEGAALATKELKELKSNRYKVPVAR